jgi:hypothetical protein
MSGASFTISSLGGIGGRYFTPIINAPEVAILGVCRSTMEPVWNGSVFEPRLMLPLSLSWDHRVIDGAAAARFNAYLGQILGDFRRVLLAWLSEGKLLPADQGRRQRPVRVQPVQRGDCQPDRHLRAVQLPRSLSSSRNSGALAPGAALRWVPCTRCMPGQNRARDRTRRAWPPAANSTAIPPDRRRLHDQAEGGQMSLTEIKVPDIGDFDEVP